MGARRGRARKLLLGLVVLGLVVLGLVVLVMLVMGLLAWVGVEALLRVVCRSRLLLLRIWMQRTGGRAAAGSSARLAAQCASPSAIHTLHLALRFEHRLVAPLLCELRRLALHVSQRRGRPPLCDSQRRGGRDGAECGGGSCEKLSAKETLFY